MKEKEPGEELIDIDEKGNPIEKEEKEKKKKSNSSFKIVIAIIICLFILAVCYYFFFCRKNVFDKTTLKNLKLKNRVFFGPITHDIQKIETAVKNEVALVITEGAIVGDHKASTVQPEGPLIIDKDEYIPDLKKLVDVVHKYNSYIILDLVHPGLIAIEPPFYSPSKDKSFIHAEIESNEMTKEDILRIQDYFVQGAIRAKKAGFDGVEIHGAQLTLVSLFSTQKYNRRTDEYGGSDENKARFIIEIVKKIREAIGNDMIISAKIDSPDDKYGITESGFLYTGKALQEAGLDLLEVSGPNAAREGNNPYFYEPTKKIAEILKIPVICIGGIKTYEQADYILKNSKIEYIAMSRELLEHPDTVKKWYLNK